MQALRLNSRGQTMISVLIAASLIVCALCGVGISSSFLQQATKAKELATLAVALESNFLSAFQNKNNYPDPSAANGTQASPNLALRQGTIQALSLQTTIGTLNIPVQSAGAPGPGAVGFLDWSLQPCTGFDGRNCILRYEVHLRKTLACGPPACPAGKEIYAYAFSYQISTDSKVNDMAPLGNAAIYDTPIDPGYYRVDASLAKCDPGSDLFMTGVNRDTGEAFCVKKPLAARCADGHLPKGLRYNMSNTDPTIELDCTANAVRTIACDSNYALQRFNPQYADPESGMPAPTGACVFRTLGSATMPGAFPANPTSPYMKKVQGTFCPVFYKPDLTTGCHLVPDNALNADLSATGGRGYCAFSSGIKNCSRTSYDRSWYDNTSAYNTWMSQHGPASSECLARQAMIPPQACDSPAPSTGWWVYTCGNASSLEHAAECGNNPAVADDPNGCTQKGAWSGTPYASGFQEVAPTAVASPSAIGSRGMSCTFSDTSTPCPPAPARDYSGNLWPRKNPKWYGGVQVTGLNCNYDPSQNGGKAQVLQPH